MKRLSRSLLQTFTTTIVALTLSCSCSPRTDNPSIPPENKEEEQGQKKDDNDKEYFAKAAEEATDALIDFFWKPSRGYFSANEKFEYWPNAHALDVLTDAYKRSGNSKYKDLMQPWYDGVKRKNIGWKNRYYDDMEWCALALQRAFQVTGNQKFDTTGEKIWGYIKQGWTEELGGGLLWRVDIFNPSKNACSNAPAAIYAARQYRATKNPDFLEWADKIYEWQHTNLFNEKTGAVYDNIDIRKNKLNKQVFTYNQGTFIGCAVELLYIHGDDKYLNDAVSAADYTLDNLVKNGVLTPGDNGDGGLFNGIFIRYLEQLIRHPKLDKAKKDRYTAFILGNARILLKDGRSLEHPGLYGPNWRQKLTSRPALTPQLSAAMLLESAASLTRDKE